MSLDCESYIYDYVTKELDKAFGDDIHYGSTASNIPSAFPYVSIEMTDEYERSNTVDSSGVEKYRNFRFSVNVYSLKSKREAKKIIEVVKSAMRAHSLLCTADVPMQMGTSNEIFRRTATFEGTTNGEQFYRL